MIVGGSNRNGFKTRRSCRGWTPTCLILWRKVYRRLEWFYPTTHVGVYSLLIFQSSRLKSNPQTNTLNYKKYLTYALLIEYIFMINIISLWTSSHFFLSSLQPPLESFGWGSYIVYSLWNI